MHLLPGVLEGFANDWWLSRRLPVPQSGWPSVSNYVVFVVVFVFSF